MAIEQTLDGFVDEVLQVLRGLPGANYVPKNPDATPGTFPFGTVYATTGVSKFHPAGQVLTDLSDVTIAWLVPMDDLANAIDYLLPFRELIPYAIGKEFVLNQNSNHIQHTGLEITVNLSPVEWGGMEMFGWLITLNGVKIQNEIT